MREATLRLIAGSHQWSQWVLPLRWKDDGNFYEDSSRYRPVPNPDIEPNMSVLEWEMEPGDAVLFDFRTVHGARGNLSTSRRRVLSLRWLGEDVRYAERPGKTSPYPNHGMQPASACVRIGSRKSGLKPKRVPPAQ